MNHVMIDIETLSTRADAAIVSIAAVKFDPLTGQVGESLVRNIDIRDVIENGFHVDGDTLIWWMSQNEEARDKAFCHGYMVLEVALVDLSNFIDEENDFVWGNPANFDLTIIENARIKLGFIVPFWNRRRVMCLRTLKNLVSESVYKADFQGVPHNPFDDCMNQIKQVHKIYKHLGI